MKNVIECDTNNQFVSDWWLFFAKKEKTRLIGPLTTNAQNEYYPADYYMRHHRRHHLPDRL